MATMLIVPHTRTTSVTARTASGRPVTSKATSTPTPSVHSLTNFTASRPPAHDGLDDDTVAGDETAVLRRLHDLGERLVTDDAAARDAVVEVALEDVEIGATDAHATHAQQRLAACRRRHGDGAGREPPRPVVKGRAHGRRSHVAKGSTTGSLGTSESDRRPRPRKTEHARLSTMGAPGEGAPCVRSITARAAASSSSTRSRAATATPAPATSWWPARSPGPFRSASRSRSAAAA